MPPKAPPKCAECQKTETLLWRSIEQGQQICQECYEQKEMLVKAADAAAAAGKIVGEDKTKDAKERGSADTKETPEAKTHSAAEEKRLRKSTRATRFKARSASAHATPAPNGSSSRSNEGTGGGGGGGGGGKSQNKGRNRRNLFKKAPQKTPMAQATTHSVESVFYKGSYLQVGDIVSLLDGEDNVYYAQIRGLLVDTYCEKSAFLTWLIPTQASPDPKDGFDAATYLIGPDEELSRKLSCLEFIMHAPSNYYLDRTTPFPLPDEMEHNVRPGGYIWTTLPEYQRKKCATN